MNTELITKFTTVKPLKRLALVLFINLAVSLLVQLSFLSLAEAGPPTFGPEFEFTRDNLKNKDFAHLESPRDTPEKSAQMEFVNYMINKCLTSQCKVIEIEGNFDEDYIVKYEDGWWFKISYDPSCVEITAKPSNSKVLKNKLKLINEDIFDAAKKIGLHVKSKAVSHHFNIGVRSAFKDSAENFLRFFVDYANHTHLAMGSLGHDLLNAPPLTLLGDLSREALQQIIIQFEAGQLKTISDVAKAIQNTVYTRTYFRYLGGSHHYQAIGLKHINNTDLTTHDAPMELRAIWAQDNAEHFLLLAKLFEARIAYLNSLKTPIIYSGNERVRFTESELKTRFYIYVVEAGLNPEEFHQLLPDKIKNAELDPFFNKTNPLTERINNIHDYLDLLESSELAQKITIDILSDPNASDFSEYLKVIAALKDKAGLTKNPFKKFEALRAQYKTKKKSTVKVYQNILSQITEQAAVKIRLNAPITCKNLFF